MTSPRPLSGLRLIPAYLDRPDQEALLAALRTVPAQAPIYTPRMPGSGKPLSVAMSNCGPLGWVTDEAGYRYQPLHPHTEQPWPPMPDIVLAAWKALAGYPHPPESCLINYYGPTAKLGLHQDRDERDFAAPVVSLSLGDTSDRRAEAQRSHPHRSPGLRRCAGARRESAARLSWRRPHHPRHVNPVAGRRADQPHAEAGDDSRER
jgi:DNA oxidative demethylase